MERDCPHLHREPILSFSHTFSPNSTCVRGQRAKRVWRLLQQEIPDPHCNQLCTTSVSLLLVTFEVKTSILHQFTELKASVVGIPSGIECPSDLLSRYVSGTATLFFAGATSDNNKKAVGLMTQIQPGSHPSELNTLES